ncbi:hypothetical protein [Pontimicrobium sp. MEBiC06410]|jgi:hypothetical protein
MARDIRELFEEDSKLTNEKMKQGHEARFLDKLDTALPQQNKPKFSWLNIAASIVIILGISYGAYKVFNGDTETIEPIEVVNKGEDSKKESEAKKITTLGDISPEFKKVEDYYVANINLELSKVKITPENKELFDGYIAKLEELNTEYNRLSLELANGPDELTVNALINNLKLRLNLMYRLQEQLKRLKTIEAEQA